MAARTRKPIRWQTNKQTNKEEEDWAALGLKTFPFDTIGIEWEGPGARAAAPPAQRAGRLKHPKPSRGVNDNDE